jgi:hypothetical protein
MEPNPTPLSLFNSYDTFKVQSFGRRHFSPEELYTTLDRIVGNSTGVMTKKKVGESFEGRPLYLISLGKGSTCVLLWSQMHGDEATATAAICDVIKYIRAHAQEESVQKMLSELTVHFLPMLNPDGAHRIRRRTAQNIDMNRDASALRTPEARVLKQLQNDLKPAFGFNLHDQELSTVETSKELTAIALLAPAMDAEKTDNDVRSRAKSLAAYLNAVLQQLAPGKIARYDDTFEPRAFGDNMQKWGTSTVLIESGHAMDDPSKESIRKLNAVALVSSLTAIASGDYAKANVAAYEALPFNGKKAYDVVVRHIIVDHGGGKVTPADLGISYQVDTHSEQKAKLVDLGDLSTYLGLKEIDGKSKKILAADLILGGEFTTKELLEG